MDKNARSVDHIDPLHSDHICGLNVSINIAQTDVSYNAAKSNKFVPYRVNVWPAPHLFGDVCEFLIDNVWTVCEFGGDVWHAECRRIGCGSTKNRVCQTQPELHVKISSLGGRAAVAAGYHFTANGCHNSERQAVRVKGKKWWHHPETQEEKRATACPGEGFILGKNQKSIERMKASLTGRKWYHNIITGRSKQLHEPIDENWVLGRLPLN